MLSTFMSKLTPRPAAPSNDEAKLLAQFTGENPDDLRRQLAETESQLAADDAAWERLDRTSNPRAFTEQQAIAARRGRLETECNTLRRRVAAAERRRAAFVALVDILDSIDQQVVHTLQQMYADFLLIASKDERRNRLDFLDGLVRLRARIAAPLAAVAPARRFSRAPDPFGALSHDLRARADEIDRHHSPGMPRVAIGSPAGAQELIDVLNGGTV